MALSREELQELSIGNNSYTSTFDFNAEMETGVGDALTSGLAASVVSGTVGMINTGGAVLNMFGADNSQLKTEELLRSWDWTDTADYYADNQEVIDAVGFAVSTLVPGAIGLKAAKYAQTAANASTSKNLLAVGLRKVLVPQSATARIQGEIIKDTMNVANRSTRLGIAAKNGFHQAAVETAFAETAILLSTNQHVTVNSNQLGYFEAMWEQKEGAALGFGLGLGIGGAINTAITSRGINSLIDGVERSQNQLFKSMMNMDSRANRIGFNQGNKVVELSKRFKDAQEEFSGLAGADLKEFTRREKELVADLWEEVAVLTGEASKGRNALGRREVDGHLTPAIMQIIQKGDSEQLADMFRGSSAIGKYDDVDFLFDPAAQPLSVAKNEDDYADLIGESLFGEQWQHPSTPQVGASQRATAKEYARTSNGISITREDGMRFRDNIVKGDIFKGGNMLDNESVIGVIRHEVGHGETIWLNKLFGSKVFAPVTNEMVTLSRMRRPTSWAHHDRLAKQLEEFDAMAKAKGGKLPPSKWQERAAMQKSVDYFNDPNELLADSWAMFNARDPKQRLMAEGIGTNTHKILSNNGALKTRLGKSEKLLGLKSGKTYDTAQWAPTVADRGVPVLKAGTVTSGSIGTKIDGRNFSVLNSTPDDASAYYYAAMKDGKKLKKDLTTRWDNFYDLTMIQHRLDTDQWAGKLTIDLEDGKQLVLDSTDDATDMLNEFNRHFTEFKGKAAGMLNKRELNKRNNSPSQIARIIDSDENFAMSNGIDNHETTVAHWSRENDPAKPTVAKVFYDTPIEDTEKGTSALAEAMGDNMKILETVDENISAFFAQLDDLLGEGLTHSNLNATAPSPSWKHKGSGDVTDVTRHAQLTGVLKTFQGMYGEGTSKLQAIAKFNELAKLKVHEEIQRLMTNVSQQVSSSPAAIMELNALDSLLRQKFYKFAPAITNRGEADAYLSTLVNRVTPEQGAKNMQKLMDSPTGANLISTMSKKDTLWARETEELVAKIMNQKSFQASNLTKLDNLLGTGTTTIKTPAVAAFWKAKVSANRIIVNGKQVAAASRGYGSNLDSDVLYPGGLNTSKYKHRKYIQPAKDEVWSHNQKGIIGANTPEELAQKEAQVRQQFGNDVNIISKEEMEDHFKKTGSFLEDFSLNEYQVNRDMMRKGINWDVAPEPDPNLVAHYIRDSARDWSGTVDNLTELRYSEEFASLQQGDSVSQAYGTLGAGKQKPIDTSFREAQNIMLNRTTNESSTAWRDAQQSVDKTITKVFNGLSSLFKSAGQTGKYQEMDSYMKHHGLPRVYEDQTGEMLRTSVDMTDQALAGIVPKVNGIAATLMLRLDFVQPMVNALSMPIMSVPEMNSLMKSIPAIQAQQLAKGLSVGVPGTKYTMGTNMKLQMQAVKEFFTEEGKVHLKRYYDEGIITNVVREMRQVADDITIDVNLSPASIAAKVENAAKVATNFAARPADWAEDFVKFVAARQADILLDGAGITDKSIRSATLRSYTTRVHGNYVHAQRPAIFQGFAGQAIGLFQTYQFNLIQSLLSKIGNKNGQAVASMMGIQAGMFGVQSVPGFRALNEYIAMNSQEDNDMYSAAADLVGQEESEWMMFGLASNFTKPLFGEGLELYTRGDLNPRTPFLIPTSLAEVPIYAMSTKFVGNIFNAASDLSQGVDAGQVMADTLAHNGVNRPLAGVGAILAGSRTTGKGSLIANLSDLSWFGKAARTLGTKTLDESIAVQAFYRTKGFDTKRNDRLQDLGRGVKRMVQADQYDSQVYDQFFSDYTSNGGSPEKYNQWMHSQALGATESSILKMYESNNSTSGRYLQKQLGYDIDNYINPVGD